ncbi:MAG: hypothetical protein EXQ86_03385 [Rhodospirillales bacterium]|nr:hypothetical protein [Rhodospirillales bacterium]
MSLFSFARSKPERAPDLPPPIDPRWAKSAKGRFYRLVQLDTDRDVAANTSAVFAIWHGGVKPGWVYVGRTANLAKELKKLAADSEILFYHKHGGLSVSWANVKPEYQGGVVRYLIDVMKPIVENSAERRNDEDTVPVILPGA